MPFIDINLWKGRSREQKKDLIKRVSREVAECIKCPLESVQVIVTEIDKRDWGVGGITGDELAK